MLSSSIAVSGSPFYEASKQNRKALQTFLLLSPVRKVVALNFVFFFTA